MISEAENKTYNLRFRNEVDAFTCKNRSHFNRFLIHLEQRGRTWSELGPTWKADWDPAALEQASTRASGNMVLNGTRGLAINKAFVISLRL
ncbi:hypothetical protein KDW41_24830 [Burkholderia vietnamiensis]|nr:hypothetical protein [Burkholderia vietnamiensis]